jgi:GntR family transcriptional repressor for pyruvate dehydrogenase complex
MAVVGITPTDAIDNFAILAALAGKAAQMATERMGAAELGELQRLAGEIDGSDDVVGANRRFHRAVNHAARSPRLLVYLRQAVRVVPGNYFELFPEQEQRSKREHAALLRAMAAGDTSMARRVAENHVLAAGQALGGYLAALATDRADDAPVTG